MDVKLAGKQKDLGGNKNKKIFTVNALGPFPCKVTLKNAFWEFVLVR
jgi:hypothetical protein